KTPKEGVQRPGPLAANLLDGRINNDQTKDVAAPVAVYCTAEDTIAVYRIDAETGDGTLVIEVPQLTASPETNTEMASIGGISLYALPSGEYQLDAPNFE